MNEKAEVDCGCVSCAALLVAFLFFWALFVGLPIDDKVYNVDIFCHLKFILKTNNRPLV